MFSGTPRSPRIGLLFGTVLVCLMLTSCQGEPPARNVVLLSIDTLRSDHLGCYGYRRNTSPRIDEFAARGVRFETVLTTEVSTFPAHASMLTGQYTPTHGVMGNGEARMSDSVVTLAEVFKEKGYSTGAFVASFVLDSRFGLDQGFDVYDDNFEGGLARIKWGIGQKNRVHVWPILDGYADGSSYEVEIQHAMRGNRGGFNFVAWADADGEGLPDTLIGRSEWFEKPGQEWSRWRFETDSKRIFVGYEFEAGAEVFSRNVPPPAGYDGLGTIAYCCSNRGEVPVKKEPDHVTNIRVTATRPDGTTRTFGMTGELLPRAERDWRGHEVLYFERRAEDVNKAAMAWLSSHSDEPFFLFIHYYDPHSWYSPPGKYAKMFTDPNYEGKDPRFLEGRWQRDLTLSQHRKKPMPSPADRDHMIGLYDGEIAYSDSQVGVVLDTLTELGLTENTLVVITSDHGEYMTEHGWCFGHIGQELHDPTLLVPLLVAGPRVPAGVAAEYPVQVVDIPATVLELLGQEPVETFWGKSLYGLMRGDSTIDRDACYVHHKHASALWTPEWKFVLFYPASSKKRDGDDEDLPDNLGKDRLHNLRNDPGEEINLVKSEPELAKELAARIVQFKKACTEATIPPTKLEMDEESRRKLKALGYL